MATLLSTWKTWTGGVLLAVAFTECLRNESERDIWNDPNYAVFMVLGDLLLLLWMWGVSVQVWRSSGIAWATLLGLESTKLATLEVPEAAVYETAMELSVVYLACFVVFNMSIRNTISSSPFIDNGGGATYLDSADAADIATNTSDIGAEVSSSAVEHKFGYAHMVPLLLLGYIAYRAVTPWSSRGLWWHHLKCVICAPVYAVTFRCGYIGDLLTSLVRVLVQALYAICYLLLVPYALLTHSESPPRGGASATTSTSGSTNAVENQLGAYQFLYSNKWWHDSTWLQRGVVPWLSLLPLWIRLMQCLRRSVETGHRWPHSANALKYTSAILVISVGTLVPEIRTDGGLVTWVWVLAFVSATCYQFAWDITMDWGLLVPAASDEADTSIALAAALSVQLGQDESTATRGGEMQPRRSVVRRVMQWLFGGYALRRRRLLGPLWVYLTIILGNFVLRFAWTLTLIQASSSNSTNNSYGFSLLMAYLTPLIAAAEVMRRMVWGFLRLEWEHVERLQAKQNRAESGNAQASGADADGIEGTGAAAAPLDLLASSSAASSSSSSSREEVVEAAQVEPEAPFEAMMTSGYSNPRGSTTLYGAVDPDGRFHVVGPVLSLVRSLSTLAIDATGHIAERGYAAFTYIFGQGAVRAGEHPEDVAAVQEVEVGYYRRLFENAAWCVYPFKPSFTRQFASKCGPLFGLQPPSNASQYDHKLAFAEEEGEKEEEEGDEITSLVSAAANTSLYERQCLLLTEAAAFSGVVLVFLFSLTVLRGLGLGDTV